MQTPLLASLSALQPRRLKVHCRAACLYWTIRSERRASFYEVSLADCFSGILLKNNRMPSSLPSPSAPRPSESCYCSSSSCYKKAERPPRTEAGAILRATWGSLIVRFRRFIRANELANFPTCIKYFCFLPFCRPVLPAAAGARRAAGRGGNRRRLAPQGSELHCNFAKITEAQYQNYLQIKRYPILHIERPVSTTDLPKPVPHQIDSDLQCSTILPCQLSIDSCSIDPLADGFFRTQSTGGFYRPVVSSCTCV